MRVSAEKRLLQLIVIFACFVPIIAGSVGIFEGAVFSQDGTIQSDSHFRYLCGLLLGIGLSFLRLVPHIERHAVQVRLLTAIVIIGGVARLLAVFSTGIITPAIIFALAMELIITPLLCRWQHSLARRFAN